MKQCPTCQSQYTDDTLQFCLQDGSPLRFVSGYGEQETVVSNRPSNQNITPPLTNPTSWNPQQSNAGFETTEKKSSAATAVFLTVFVMLILFGAAGIGAWIYFRGVKPDDNTNILLARKTPAPDTANTSSTSPVRPTTAANTNTAANTSATPVDKEKIKQDVTQRINSWTSAAEARNLGNYMSSYAPTVDYYNKKGANVAAVRADKEKAFTQYDSIDIDISNLTVTPDASGNEATAVFDKKWSFEGQEKSSNGKVQTQLKLKRINGQWLITGERDLKVYESETVKK